MRYLNNSITLFDFDNIFFLPSFYKPEKLVKSNGNLIFDKYINKKTLSKQINYLKMFKFSLENN